MKYWIGVVGTKQTLERFNNGESDWFCLPRSASLGDVIIMYATKKLARQNHGFFGVYKIVRLDPTSNQLCNKYGINQGTLIHVDLLVINSFKNKITLPDLKSHPIHQNMSFVRRNAQGTSFSISEAEYAFILSKSQ